MYEVTIPLRPVGENEVGLPEDYFKIIQDEYASRYLELLNIASTPANRANFIRYRFMDDCEIQGIWPDLRTSSLADALRIVPPLRQRLGDFAELDEADRGMWAQWYGQADPINVKPPGIAGVGTAGGILDLENEDLTQANTGAGVGNGTAAAAAGGGAGGAGGADNLLPIQAAQSGPAIRAELAAELERVRQVGDKGLHGAELCKRLGGNWKLDEERRERLKQELITLKAKYILPFACERPAKESGQKAELVVWPMEGSLEVRNVPQELHDEIFQPIRITLEDVRKNTIKFVDENMPLELLTSRKEPEIFGEVRGTLRDPDVARLTGLLAHLLHWVAIMPLRKAGPQLSESAMQSLFVAIHELWSQFEKYCRDSKLGVSFVLPCLMLTLKRGIERCFELSYPQMMGNEVLRQQVVDRINTLLMRLFDPDGVYARFGKFDGSGKAILLSKKLDTMLASQGNTHVKRLCGRMHRSTPLVRAVLGSAVGAGGGKGFVADSKTRVMMLQSDLGGAVPTGSVVEPPRDKDRQCALLRAAMHRLSVLEPKHAGSARSFHAPPGQTPHPPEAGTPAPPSSTRTPRSRPAPTGLPNAPQAPKGAQAGSSVVTQTAATAAPTSGHARPRPGAREHQQPLSARTPGRSRGALPPLPHSARKAKA
mmetsp:Transcript_98751/g.171103  ORF Transcript_98751/g.171103 Transcript_98751/m.171103 type:complete len:654 (-) Transcript_98751:63-2024(-)